MLRGMVDEAAPEPAVAVGDLYRSDRESLVRLAALLVDDDELAAELVQEAFARLYRRWDSLRTPASASGYLRVTVLNLARSQLRRRRVARRHIPRPDVAASGADEPVQIDDEHRRVVDAVRRLPRRQRELVVLKYWSGLSEAEIAAALGISTGTVKTHGHRAIAALTAALEDGP